MDNFIDIELRYQQLLSFKIHHQYFKKLPENFFKILPSQETIKKISQSGMQLFADDKEIALMYSSDKEAILEQFLMKNEEIVLDFYIYFQNPYFLNLTQLPWQINKKIFYFSTVIDDIENKEINVSKDEFVTEKDSYLGAFSTFQGKKLQKNSKIFGKSKNNIELSDKIIVLGENYTVNLSEVPFGLYQIEEDKQVTTEFVHLPNLHKTPAAMFQVSLGKKWQQNILQLLNDKQSLPTKTLNLKFKARQAYWRYYLLPKYIQNFQNLAINTGQDGLNFKKAEQVVLPNGKEALKFESEIPLEIREDSLYQFELSRKSGAKVGNATDLILQKLPTPAIDSLKPDKVKPEVAYSDMYVYL